MTRARMSDRGATRARARPWKRLVYPVIAVTVFLAVAVSVRLVWEAQDRYATTGDEPHYLVAARSLAHFHTVDMTEAYGEEFTRRVYYPPGFPAAPGALPTEETTAHATKGPRGYALEHGLGIPAVIAVPNEWWGPTGARMWLIVLSSGIVLVAWYAGGLAFRSQEARLAATLVVAAALPWVTSANQIFPDLLAGVACGAGVLGCARLALPGAQRSARIFAWVAAVALVLLPWLHIRFAATGAILALSLALVAWRARAWPVLPAAALVVPFGLSTLGALVYNAYVFGGPFAVNGTGSAHIGVGKGTAMVFLGLHIDRLQGMFVHNPLLVFGVVGTALLWTRARALVAVIALTYASVVVLPSIELFFYGGQSPAPRFALAGAGVLVVPAMLALGALRGRTRWGFVAIVGAAAVLEGWYLVRVLSEDFSLYNLAVPSGVPAPSEYDGLVPGPEFFDPDRYLESRRNHVAVVAVLGVIAGLTAWLWPRRAREPQSAG